MINRENIAIYPVINTEQSKTNSVIMVRELLKDDFLEEVVKHAAVSADDLRLEFVFIGNSRKISHDLLMKLGKLPEDQRNLAVSQIIKAIPSCVKEIAVNELPLPYPEQES